jgi:hypothetical protein
MIAAKKTKKRKDDDPFPFPDVSDLIFTCDTVQKTHPEPL